MEIRITGEFWEYFLAIETGNEIRSKSSFKTILPNREVKYGQIGK
jgi:hypothetical protein